MIKKYKLKKLLLPLALISVLLGVNQASKPTLRELANDNVVMLTNKDATSGGTGFYVKAPSGKVYILTNAHVCDGLKNELQIHTYGRTVPGRVIESSDHTDLCLVDANNKEDGLDLSNDVQLYEDYVIFGHPRLYPLIKSKGEFVDYTRVQILEKLSHNNCDKPKQRKGSIPLYIFGLKFGDIDACFIIIDVFISDILVHPGNSGSPVMNYKGEIVGIVAAGDTDTHYSMIVDLYQIQHFLKAY